MDQIMVMLPQTLMRFWGIKLKRNTEFYQFEYLTRHKNDHIIKNSIYKLNTIMLNQIGFSFNSQISINKNYEFESKECTIDSHILTHKKHFPSLNNINVFSVVPYISIGHYTVSLIDIQNIKHFLRSLIRSFRLWKSYKPRSVWSWNYEFSKSKFRLTDFLWTNKEIDHSQIKKVSTEFLQSNSANFPELSYILESDRILLILPPFDIEFQTFIQMFKSKLQNSKIFAEKFLLFDKIFIKQHRIYLHEFPDTFELFSKKFIVLNSPLSHVLPAEIIILANQHISLLTCPTSAMFARIDIPVYMLNDFNDIDNREYGFMLKKARRNGMEIL
jgi:hypothetical protein